MKSFAIGTGSAGNCIYIENEVLVDVGFSYKRIVEGLKERNVGIEEIKKVFITHSHGDHIGGFKAFFKNTKVSFYMSKECFEEMGLNSRERVCLIKNHDIIDLENGGRVFVVEKSHDVKCLGFVFENGIKIGVFTDLGIVSNEIKHLISSLNVLYIEANYCEEYIKKSSQKLNYVYLNRLRSDKGHLSIEQTIDALKCFEGEKVVLAHVSDNTNSYENVYRKIKKVLSGVEVLVSFQDEVV